MEISCVSSLDYCSGCQNPHRYTSYTRWHIHTHSIAYPNQALGVLSLLLLLSLWSFTGVWFFRSFSLFKIPVPQSPSTLFLILCSFRLLSSHYHSLRLPHDPLFSTFLLSFWAQHASSLAAAAFCFIPFFLSSGIKPILFTSVNHIYICYWYHTFTSYHFRFQHFRAHVEFGFCRL